MDIDAYIQWVLMSIALREPTLREMIMALKLPIGSRGLDAGYGIGLQCLLLAEFVGLSGHVTGLDLSPELLVYVNDVVKKAGFSERISFREGDINNLPFDGDTFDWVLNVDCVRYAPFIQGKKPELHFLRALGWFHKLGLKAPRAKFFANCVSAPLGDGKRNALTDLLFNMRWPNVTPELSGNDLAEFRRLCKPDSPDFLLNLSDYYALFTYTMLWGRTAD